MITFRDCVNIYLACQAKNDLFKCDDCPCGTIVFRDDDGYLINVCDKLTSLKDNFNSGE